MIVDGDGSDMPWPTIVGPNTRAKLFWSIWHCGLLITLNTRENPENSMSTPKLSGENGVWLGPLLVQMKHEECQSVPVGLWELSHSLTQDSPAPVFIGKL